MSEPRTDYASPLQGLKHELMSAMSALNMEPMPLEEPKGIYLSQRDHWAEHSLDHLYAAMEVGGELSKKLYELQMVLFKLLKEERIDGDVYDELNSRLLPILY